MKRDEATVSYTMSRIKGRDTGIEMALRRALYALGVRYRANVKTVFGHPDIAIKKYKVAVFCDSEFWHGWHFEENEEKIKTHRDYWIPKIRRNIERDKEVNEKLKEEGYLVLRFWGAEIEDDPEGAAKKVLIALYDRGYRPKGKD